MAAKEEMTLWTGYFDSRLSRSDGRRVPKKASIPKPTLESVVWAARNTGIRKMRQEPEASHPSRPYAKEGRLVMPPRHVLEVTGESSKERFENMLDRDGDSIKGFLRLSRVNWEDVPDEDISLEIERRKWQMRG